MLIASELDGLANNIFRYRTITPKARLIPLTQPFLEYLRSDGIILPSDDERPTDLSDSDSGVFSSTDNPDASDDEEEEDISAQWRGVHIAIKDTIAELGGNVVPKLNWSAPKDATWINAGNSMECRTPGDVYLLLKSSDFITHDLEHAFDDCIDDSQSPSISQADVPYHLILRKYILLNPSVEFRCFVRDRKLIGLCQRDLNHFDFLFKMQDKLQDRTQEFFDVRLRDTFPDENFVFDVYVPPPHDRVWLIDVNPWAPRTDPLLFSWLELLTMPEPPEPSSLSEEVVSIPIRSTTIATGTGPGTPSGQPWPLEEDEDDASDEDSEADEEIWRPEFRLVNKDDPEAYSFNTPQYSAHKLPRDVVDASADAGGLREFAETWKDILAKRQKQDQEESSDDD